MALTTDRANVLFRMTGRREGAGLEPVDTSQLRPALLARYRDLTSLRYDFPVALAAPVVMSLSAIVDQILQQIGHGDDGERVTRHVLRLEREIRAMSARGVTGLLSTLWRQATEVLDRGGDPALAADLDRARKALTVDGAVVDCDADLPGHLIRHVWTSAQASRTARFREKADRLAWQLSEILRAADANSAAGRTPSSLEASIGSAQAGAFDFEAMSRILSAAAPATTIPDARRARILEVLSVLERRDVVPATALVFRRCSVASAAWRERLPKIAALARALAIAELEVVGEYRETVHDAFFETAGPGTLDPEDLALFSGGLVVVHAASLDALEHAALTDMLASGLPVKVLVQWDDLLDDAAVSDGQVAFGLRARELTHAAIGLGVFVLQAASAHLYQQRDRIADAMDAPGPALISVFSGATGHACNLPAYLVSAAAMESRAFPAFIYDPSAGPDWASRFRLDGNSQIDRDWPIQPFGYEGPAHDRMTGSMAFTLVDFAACDDRLSRHLARVARAANGQVTAIADLVAAGATASTDAVPGLLMVDRGLSLHQVIVDDRLVREARRCREAWHSLQELGGVHNSHAERLLARERDARARSAQDAAPAAPAPTVAAAAAPSPVASPPPASAPDTPASEDPYIETPRCSTCNECTRINPRMFAYNDNKQAYIKDPDAGTYAQFVEAAESCQVAIIHPGKPRNPNEPGLDALVERAQAFR